jgi:hypothetical protein
MAFIAKAASFWPRTFAGSPVGPMMRKSLCMMRRPPIRSPLST